MARSDGYKEIMHHVRLDYDGHDPYGFAMSNLFGLATAAYAEYGTQLDGFGPAPSLTPGDDLTESPDVDYQYMIRRGHVSRDDVETAYRVLSRYRDLIPDDRTY